MSLILKTTCMVLLAVMAEICLSGAVYFWTDDDGFKHFSNISPPQNGGARLLNEEKFLIPRGHQFIVIKIFDGDTLRVAGFGLQFTIRLAGIDTPEIGHKGQTSQPYSRQAKQELTRLIDKKTVSLKQYGTDGYNRVLAEIFANDTNINLELVRSGLAEVYQGKWPDGFDATPYLQAEQQARHARKGIWGRKNAYESPRQWRREHPVK